MRRNETKVQPTKLRGRLLLTVELRTPVTVMSTLLAFIAAAGYAASDLTTARAVRTVRPAAVALWAHVLGAALLLGAAAATAPSPGAHVTGAALAAGLVAGVGVVAYYRALKRGSA